MTQDSRLISGLWSVFMSSGNLVRITSGANSTKRKGPTPGSDTDVVLLEPVGYNSNLGTGP